MLPNILVSVPTMGVIHKHVCFVTDQILLDQRYKKQIIRPTHRPYENNLHKILNEFMAGDYTHWLNIDSDNPPMKNPLDLVKLNLSLIGLPTPVFYYDKRETKGDKPFYFNAYRFVSEEKGFMEWDTDRDKGLVKVDAIGTGCFLASRRIFELPGMRDAPFQRMWNKDGTVEYGNDLAFCLRLMKHNVPIFAHFDYPCRHFHELDMFEVIEAFMEWSPPNA